MRKKIPKKKSEISNYPYFFFFFFKFRKIGLILETAGPNKVVPSKLEPEMLTYLIFRALRSNQK